MCTMLQGYLSRAQRMKLFDLDDEAHSILMRLSLEFQALEARFYPTLHAKYAQGIALG